jgi:adenylate cyclase
VAEQAAWPRRPSAVLDWLVGPARHLGDGAAVQAELCRRMVEDGLPLARVSFHIRTLHPQMFGVTFYWRRGMEVAEFTQVPHGITDTDAFRSSPIRLLFEDELPEVRQRLDRPDAELPFLVYRELRAEGLTEHLALPLVFSDGKRHATTWATDRPGGFTAADLDRIRDLLPVLGLLIEIHLSRRIAINLLDTYVGRRAGARILAGQITRGSGETVRAAIWFCDLRDFTAMAAREERDAVIACLNQYFDCMAGLVEREGGEILKFIGDAMLAIFPLADEHACRRALRVASEARGAMAALNRARTAAGQAVLGYGIAMHVGEVMYGNIGAANRLDFTVIGPAVNIAARIEGLCRVLGPSILISEAFACQCGCADELVSVGRHALRGVAGEVELFTLAELADQAEAPAA